MALCNPKPNSLFNPIAAAEKVATAAIDLALSLDKPPIICPDVQPAPNFVPSPTRAPAIENNTNLSIPKFVIRFEVGKSGKNEGAYSLMNKDEHKTPVKSGIFFVAFLKMVL